VERSERPLDTGIVHCGVNSAEPAHRELGQVTDLLLAGHVALDEHGLRRRLRGQFQREGLPALRTQSRDDHIRALRAEGLSGRTAEGDVPPAADLFIPHNNDLAARSDRDLRMSRHAFGWNALTGREPTPVS